MYKNGVEIKTKAPPRGGKSKGKRWDRGGYVSLPLEAIPPSSGGNVCGADKGGPFHGE